MRAGRQRGADLRCVRKRDASVERSVCVDSVGEPVALEVADHQQVRQLRHHLAGDARAVARQDHRGRALQRRDRGGSLVTLRDDLAGRPVARVTAEDCDRAAAAAVRALEFLRLEAAES